MNFQETVRDAIQLGLKVEVAAEFEVAVSTVDRWASGSAAPHPRVQNLIIAWIENRKGV